MMLKKLSIVILTILVIMTLFSTVVNAKPGYETVDPNGQNVDLSGGGGDNFKLDAFDTPPTGKGVESANKIVNQTAASVIGIARIVCVTLAIVMLLVIAMKYMISAPGDRADIKKHAVNYVIGAFVLFGISGILTILNNFAQSIGK